MVTSVDLMKCACDKCLSIIRVENAINKDGKYYCSKACAEGHKTITGCAQTACGCS